MIETTILRGFCPGCRGAAEPLDLHHCHLKNAAQATIRSIVVPIVGRTESDKLFARNPNWFKCADGIAPVVRFAPRHICRMCNLIDVCHRPSRPGPFFSLSVDEISRIRSLAADRRNRGRNFLAALKAIRRDATPDYFERLQRARTLGRDIATHWLQAVA